MLTRPRLRDVLLAVAFSVLAVLEAAVLEIPDDARRVVLVEALVFGVALAFRRVAPLLCALLVAGALLFAALVDVAASEAVAAIPAVLVAAYGAGAYLRPPRDRVALLLMLVLGCTAVLLDAGAGDIPFVAVLVVAPWLAGLAMRNRTSYAGLLEERAAALEREQELRALEAVAHERLRIARDLHDVVAHSVSVMTMQAGAVRRLLPAGTDREQAVLRGVEQTGRAALEEMARMLGVLRQTDDPGPLEPQPGLDRLPALVEQLRQAGLPTQLRVEGEVRDLPPSVSLSAYRIAQEALTNTLKHAGRASAEVVLRYEGDAVSVEVLDDGPGRCEPGTAGGYGLVGMRERVTAFGGSLVAEPRPGRGFRVAARLPVQRGAR